MSLFTKISVRIALLIGIVFLINFIYTTYFFEDDLQKNSAIINKVRNVPDDTDILYLGESSNVTYAPTDADKRSISELLGSFYPSLKTADITKKASHAGIYKTLLSNLSPSCKVKTVVVTLNLRSFNSAWINSKLETPLQKSMVLLQKYPPLLNRFLLSFKGFDNKTDAERKSDMIEKWKNDKLNFPFKFPHRNVIEWDDWMANQINVPDNKMDSVEIDLACHYIKSYAFQIDTMRNPRIHDFNEIVELAKEKNWNLVFNLLAENMEKAESLVGKELTFLMKENRDLLVKYYTNKGVKVVDNLMAVESEEYIDQNWTTEHYKETGRQTIASNVAESIKDFHGAQFRVSTLRRNLQSKFYNDCEGSEKWSNEMTLSNEDSYSGKYSSKTGRKDEYSITFEFPFDRIADSVKNSVNISLMVKSKMHSENTAIILEVMGPNIKSYWESASFDKLTTKSTDWQKVNHTFKLPEYIRDGDLVKAYVLNLSEEEVFVDDFSIEFK